MAGSKLEYSHGSLQVSTHDCRIAQLMESKARHLVSRHQFDAKLNTLFQRFKGRFRIFLAEVDVCEIEIASVTNQYVMVLPPQLARSRLTQLLARWTRRGVA